MTHHVALSEANRLSGKCVVTRSIGVPDLHFLLLNSELTFSLKS